jgi:hypothetical protein
MLREAVRIHGPYTHVPYHERIDDGFVNFVRGHALTRPGYSWLQQATWHGKITARQIAQAASGTWSRQKCTEKQIQ